MTDIAGTVTDTRPETEKARRIPPPSRERVPLKVNIFDMTAGGVCTLQPLFPYLDAGAIVPTGALLTGDPDDSYWGQFFHYNTVDEVYVAFGANGSFLQSGQILVGQEIHGVNSTLRDPADGGSFALTTITQRQPEDRAQNEAVIFRCTNCAEQLLRYEINSTAKGTEGHDPSQWGGSSDDEVDMFSTLGASAEAALKANEGLARTCSKCGHLNDEFPLKKWGWKRYADQVRQANSAYRAMHAAADAAREAGGA